MNKRQKAWLIFGPLIRWVAHRMLWAAEVSVLMTAVTFFVGYNSAEIDTLWKFLFCSFHGHPVSYGGAMSCTDMAKVPLSNILRSVVVPCTIAVLFTSEFYGILMNVMRSLAELGSAFMEHKTKAA